MHRQQWRQTLAQYRAPIWSKPVDQIAVADVLEVLKPIWATKSVTAGRLRGRIEVIIDAAQALGHIDADNANSPAGRGTCSLCCPSQPSSRGAITRRCLTPTFLRSCNACGLRSLTPCRRSPWSSGFDRDQKRRNVERAVAGVRPPAATWIVPGHKMKTSEDFSVPLSYRAVAILAEARLRARKEPTEEDFVFFGGRPKRPLSPMSLNMLLRRMNVDVTPHGFRTSFRTWCSEVAHAEFEIAEQRLSHRVGSRSRGPTTGSPFWSGADR